MKWEPDTLNFAIKELRREFAETTPERVVRAVDFAARALRPELGRVRLLQKAREGLRRDV